MLRAVGAVEARRIVGRGNVVATAPRTTPLRSERGLILEGSSLAPPNLHAAADGVGPMTDERINASTAAMAGILCRPLRSRHPESCTKLRGLTGEAGAGGRLLRTP